PHVRYHRWFFNAGGSGAPNDRLRVQLSNGLQTVTVETITAATPGMGSWQEVELRIADFIEPTAQMTIRFIAEDLAPGHLVEAGVDGFEVVDLGVSGMAEIGGMDVRVWPSPNSGLFQLAVPGNGPGTVTMFDGTGRKVLGALPINSDVMTVDTDLPDGVYHVVVLREGRRSVHRVVVAR
ncbi:MAG TPA: T9SS type A sorting domain-containing protein, partial [Flavobacteriales bacterium]|nr:T9SS type A sorting domain-containing protein [Flavobacteriales bacterium]